MRGLGGRSLALLCPLIMAFLLDSWIEARCAGKQNRVATFNTALTPFVDGYPRRRSLLREEILRAAKEISIDFFCLQGVWYEQDIAMLKSSLYKTFPFHYSPIDQDGNSNLKKARHGTPCGSELDQLFQCVDNFYCQKLSQTIKLDFFTCMLQFCLGVLYGLPDICRKCVITSGRSVSSIWDLCANDRKRFSRFNPSGLFILSRYPLKADYVPFLNNTSPALVEHGYITVQVEDMPMFICTHLTGDLRPLPYIEATLLYTSYQEQNRAEMEALHIFTTSPHVLMGSLSAGPRTHKLAGEQSQNYDYLQFLGYTNHFLLHSEQCTVYGDEHRPQVTDHILTMNVQCDQDSAKRVFDHYKIGYLSDHYGVCLDICRLQKPGVRFGQPRTWTLMP